MGSYLIIELEALLLEKGKTSSDLIRATGHTAANISKIRNGKIKAIRMKTLLDICDELECQPGDLIKRVTDAELEELVHERANASLAKATGAEGDRSPERVYVVDLKGE
ncbi:XRE family transcriptional regulator [Slackia equolifaciens]|uniref:XRE family transcriptional regulator n=1 Tax=Slackia equolifaciens TaxID=498718 RepID=A0A3N0AW31_9ACTN|nr:helix-turn-helix domain-containing protein [Slackia equolifaciens]RNL39085.1 XRE family transcriptional regulator [Slackia equolifaciens]